MRIPSGVVDQYLYFVAVDSSDLITRETGLTTFTVYRARNGGAATAYTTPTVAEVSSANMPGVYSLLLDEDMTIGSGNKSEEVVLHITQASMAPVTLVYELYRPDVTDGETITVSSGAVSTVTTTTTATNVTTVNGLAAGVITAASIAADAITDAKVASDVTIASVTGAVGSVTGNVGGNVTGSVGSVATGGITAASIAADAIGASELAADAVTEIAAGVWDRLTSGLTTVGSAGKLLVDNLNATVSSRASQTSVDTVDDFLDTEIAAITTATTAASIRAAVGLASANLDTQLDALPTNAELATSQAAADDATLAAIAALSIPTAAAIADAVWDEDATAHQTQGTFGQAIGDPVLDTGTIYKAVVTDATGATVGVDVVALKAETAAILADTDVIGATGAGLTSLATQASVNTIDDFLDTEVAAILAAVDTEVGAIKAKTDSLTFTVAGVLDANVLRVGGTVQTAGDIIGDTNDIQARLPAALVSGRIDASVGAMASAVITATAIAADAITDAKVASDVTIASVTGAVGSVTGSVGSVASGGITATSIAADAIGASELAADAVTEIAAGVWDRLTSALTTVGSAGKLLVDNLNATVGSRASQTSLDTVDDFVDTEIATLVSQTSAASIRSAVGLASANLDTQIGTLATAAALATVDDFIDTEVATIVSQTSAASIRSAVGLASANLDTQIGDIPTNAELATSQAAADDATLAAIAALSIPTAAAIADAVWDEDATAHQTQGTFGQAIGDPAADTDSIWALANANLDAAVSSRLPTASYTSPLSAAGTRSALGMASANLDTQLAKLDTIDDFLDTEIAALTTAVDALPTNAELATALAAADDAVLAAIAALNNLSAAQVNAEVVDALATDTYAEPGQGTPGATISLAAKVNYIYKALRNKSTVTATEHSIFNDDAVTVDHKRTISDDATTFTSGELTTGP